MVISTDQINKTNKTDQTQESDNAAVIRELQKIADLKKLQQHMDAKAYETLIADAKRVESLRGEKGFQSKLQKDPGIKVLSNLARDLAKLGVDITPKMLKKSLNGKINDELETILNKSILKEDKLDLTKDAVRTMRDREQKQNDQESQPENQSSRADIKKLITSSDVKEALQRYSSAYAEEALQANPEAKEKLKDAESTLKQKGFSNKDLEALERSVDRSLKTDFISRMQENFIRQVLTPKDAFQFVTASDDLDGNIFQKTVKEENIKIKDDQVLPKKEVRRAADVEVKQAENEYKLENRQKKVDINKMDNSFAAKDTVQQNSGSYTQYAAAASLEAAENLERENAQPKNDDILPNKEVIKAKDGKEKQEASGIRLESRPKKTAANGAENSFGAKDAVQQNSGSYTQFVASASREAVENLERSYDRMESEEIMPDRAEGKKDRQVDGGREKADTRRTWSAQESGELVQQNAGAFAQFVVKSSPEVRKQLEHAYDRLEKEEVKRTEHAEGKQSKHIDVSREKADTSGMKNAHETREAVRQYSGVFAQFVVAASPEAREKLEDMKDKLKKKGVSEKEILSIERAVKKSYRTEYTSEIQDNFTKHMFSPKNSFQSVVTSRQLNNAFEDAIKAEQLSGISSDPQDVKEQMSKISQVSHAEIRDFIKDAVESRLMERHISNKNNRHEVKKLVDLGYKVGFNFDNFLKTWEQKKFDLGLFVLEIENASMAQNAGEISIGEVSAGGVNDKHGYEMTKDEERELLINQLRAEYLKKAITGDPFAVFSFAPKIRKLKNGLIKLGLETDDFMKIEKEAKVLARYRTLEMLKQSFIERATYYELSGPAYGLLKNKLKGLVSNLTNLDMELSKEQLDYLRDEANRQMHDHTIIELNSAVALLENHENPAVEEKVPLMIKLIQRLKEESGFNHGVGEDIDEVVFRHENGQKALKEDA